MTPGQRRQRRGVQGLTRDLRLSLTDIEPGELAPRAAAVVFLAAGLLALAVGLFGLDGDVPTIGITAALATVFGSVCLLLPWQRWPVRAQLVIPLFAFAVFALGGVLAQGTPAPYLAMLPLPFVFVGFTQPPGTSSLLAPIGAIALVVAGRFDISGVLVTTLLFALPMSVIVGEAIALAQARRARAEARVERLLEAVRVLARVDDARNGAHLVAALAAELLDADAVAVLLADRPTSRRYLNRAFFGHPALAEAAPLLLDGLGPDEILPKTSTQFLVDPAKVKSLAHSAACVRALAIVPLPGDGGATVGVVIAMWTASRRRLPASARQAAELLSEEAGRMFQRLWDTAALAHDAETDPLTQLANRRTFTRALQTMQPGDALVIVDLDHFKGVNDRYGHQAGDITLRLLARCLRETCRQVDCVARYGGEEFAVVLPDAGATGALTMLHRVRRAWEARNPMTMFSAGVAVHEESQSPRETLRQADAALYAAKEGGRNRDVLAPESSIVLP